MIITFIAGPLVAPIVENAGQDISHWFNEKTGNVSGSEITLAYRLVILICVQH